MSAKFSIDAGRYFWFWMPWDEWREVGFQVGDKIHVEKTRPTSFTMTRLTNEEYRRLTGGKSRQKGFMTLRRFPGHSDAWGFSTSALNFGVGPVGTTEIELDAESDSGVIYVTLPHGLLKSAPKTEEEAPEPANGSVNADMIQNLAEALSVVNAAINEGYATPGIEDGVITLTVQQVLRG